MTMTPSEFPAHRGRRWTKNRARLEAFIKSGHRCVLVDDLEYKSNVSCVQTLVVAIKRNGLENIVEAHIRGGKVYLVRVDMQEEGK